MIVRSEMHLRYHGVVQPAQRHGLSDTSPDAERVLIDGLRRMSPAEKLRQVQVLNRALIQMSRAGIRKRHGEISERETQLRLAALRLDAATMRRVFGWDPEREGY